MFFEHLQGWGLHHLPGQSVPTPDHSFSEEIFPNIQLKPPLKQLEAIASRPITGYLGEETNTCLNTTSFQVVVESDKVPPQPLLQTKQPQFSQLLLVRLLVGTRVVLQVFFPPADNTELFSFSCAFSTSGVSCAT